LFEPRNMQRAGHVGRRHMHVRFWWAEGKESLGRPRHRQKDNVHADLNSSRITECRLASSGSKQRPRAGCCKNGDEPSVCVESGGLFD